MELSVFRESPVPVPSGNFSITCKQSHHMFKNLIMVVFRSAVVYC